MKEYFFQCPHCWETISMLFDSSINNQDYIEDCEVCCNPVNVNVVSDNFELISLTVTSIEQ